MKLAPRHTVISLLILAFALGLALLLASAQPAVAEPVSVTPLPPVENTDGRAGACYAHYYGPGNRPFLPLVSSTGVRHDRVDFRRDAIDEDGYGGHDSIVDDELAAGIDPIVILWATPADFRKSGCNPGVTVAGEGSVSPAQRPPGWYAPEIGGVRALAVAGSDPGACPPVGLYNSWTTEKFNGNRWAEFVYNTVLRYQDRVKVWEIWNEPEWSWFWLGSEAEYAQLLKVGYQATKAACSDCTVLFAGLHYWADPTYFERVLDTLNDDPAAEQNNDFFDMMSVHLYGRASTTYDVVNQIRSRMQVYVPDHPIWLTETGVPVYDGVYPGLRSEYSATEAEAAAYLIQSYANAIAADVGRYHWFRVHDDVMSEHFGLTHDETYLRPAYVAYQVATTYLISPTFTSRVPAGPHMRVTLWGTPGGKVSVLWNDGPTTGVYTLSAALDGATVVNSRGVTEAVSAAGGVYTFTLPGATATRASDSNDYIIGGEPVIVVETETPNAPPTSTVHPLPEVTCFPAFTVTWEGQDNQAGVWRYDVQVRDGADGEWVAWQDSTAATSAQFTGLHGHTYYFRSRATDRVGHREAWPEEPQAHTRLDILGTLTLSVGGFFADENSNGVWDRPITATNEITLTSVALRFVDGAGQDVVSPTVGSTWRFTTTIQAGQTYRLWAISADHMRAMSFAWAGCGAVYTETYPALGLRPVTRTYLPLTFRSG
jgi:hypothetical protein